MLRIQQKYSICSLLMVVAASLAIPFSLSLKASSNLNLSSSSSEKTLRFSGTSKTTRLTPVLATFYPLDRHYVVKATISQPLLQTSLFQQYLTRSQLSHKLKIGMNSVRYCPRNTSLHGTKSYESKPLEPEVPGSNPGGPAIKMFNVQYFTTAILLLSMRY